LDPTQVFANSKGELLIRYGTKILASPKGDILVRYGRTLFPNPKNEILMRFGRKIWPRLLASIGLLAVSKSFTISFALSVIPGK
jgi:hypothetical protein